MPSITEVIDEILNQAKGFSQDSLEALNYGNADKAQQQVKK